MTAWQPLSATRRTSAAIFSGFHIIGIDSGMKRPGYAPHHDSMCQSLYARTSASANGSSCAAVRVKSCPQNCGKRREAHRTQQAVGVHVLDAIVDVVATGPHVVERLRIHRVLLGRTARDRIQPDVRQLLVLERPHIDATLLADELRRARRVLVGESTLEEVGRLHHMVIDADENEVFQPHANPQVRNLTLASAYSASKQT